jgi:formiminoglutamase
MLQNNYFRLSLPTAKDRDSWISRREGEFRIGQETLFRSDDSDSWKQRRYHILGIAEDIGPRANGGLGGADKAFEAFIGRFLAIQSNRYLSGNELVVHGVISEQNDHPTLGLRDLVVELDQLVVSWAREVAEAGGIPVVIGGGHNNAFGLIKGVNLGHNRQLSVVNLDPHADTRELEGRHSGNPFSYAWGEGYLLNYTVLGMHQSYNNEGVLKRLELMKSKMSFFEDWVDDPRNFYNDIEEVAEHYVSDLVGIELDMDSIANMPSSAYTPSGVSVEQARYYVRRMARLKEIGYVHFPEAAPSNDLEKRIVGKSLSYLVADFIKCHSAV